MKKNKVKQNYKHVKENSDRVEPKNLSLEHFEIQCKAFGLRKAMLHYRATSSHDALLSFTNNSFSSAWHENKIAGIGACKDGWQWHMKTTVCFKC